MVEDSSILELIRSGDRSLLKELYERYRKEFAQWVNKYYRLDENEIAEIYQRSFIAFFYNVKEGRLTKLNSSLKTYLFAIGKNIMLEQMRNRSKKTEYLEVVFDQRMDYSIMDKYDKDDRKEKVGKLLHQVGEPCKTVLDLFYFKQYSLESIARELNYKTEQIAAKRKFICLKQLHTLIEQRHVS